MKKPLTLAEAQPRNATRADLNPTEGFGVEVDGRMKMVFPTLQAALKRARDLKAEFPMLQIKVYDAAEKKSTLLETARVQSAVSALGTSSLARPPIDCSPRSWSFAAQRGGCACTDSRASTTETWATPRASFGHR